MTTSMIPEKAPPGATDQDSKHSEGLVLRYTLHDLPTAQHKAGLAGLLLMLESMRRRKIAPIPEVVEVSAHGASIKVTAESLQSVFDDYYDGANIEIALKNKRAGEEPLREDESETIDEDGKSKIEKRFIYEIIQPKAAFLSALNGDQVAWTKLYREVMWNILRGRPATQIPYKTRLEGVQQNESEKLWQALEKSQAKKKGPSLMPIASSIFIGAQAESAEKIGFQGIPEENLLLHFWPLASRIFCPATVDLDGKTNDVGFVLVIPEPLDLQYFCENCLEMLASLGPELSGYRPSAARIDVPAEGGLEYLGALARHRADGSFRFSVSAVESYHLEKVGNNVQMHGMQRIEASRQILDRYERFKQNFRNGLFKVQHLANLLADAPWYRGFISVMAFMPAKFFIQKTGETPGKLSFFGRDAWYAFSLLQPNNPTKGGQPMSEEMKDELLAQRVYEVVRTYVMSRTEDKSGITYDSFKENRDENGYVKTPESYRDAKEKVCMDAFLAIRGRTEQDFVEYFAGTLCSVPQNLKKDRYVEISNALFTEWEKVKTLSLLALSAVSWSFKPITSTSTFKED
ncbi:MAG TPA: type I-MYXAN CRISPR-associated protein Cmx8 [Candidatus Hydrogenedentes bacterium]|nr:MAG: hypothetical protein BWY07_02359 [Candidatus Hydrogenedentes bacterium ADurb.Bin170]HNZ49433.1 type I-MYXAN CRISPR-associated protein Cmx8 [Candidatus Hydrogenedentota bacterium]HOD96299.1 type I-MYXAN CRISPR-associated protein Cmx8 [Candidatus Hydrogenedentota bacterium]HOR51298.1 type I-MYXAN CRISPR-associated protein Cmx8 [Candidatus Hydrogenedentota bacterium]HPK25727.1 type I-MYXAN CRISPR-associated protein Cmx8 [Candidatus Hydrogenedentota bacterium]